MTCEDCGIETRIIQRYVEFFGLQPRPRRGDYHRQARCPARERCSNRLLVR